MQHGFKVLLVLQWVHSAFLFSSELKPRLGCHNVFWVHSAFLFSSELKPRLGCHNVFWSLGASLAWQKFSAAQG